DETMASALETRVEWLARRMASAPIPVIPAATTCLDVSAYGRGLLTKHGLTMLSGLDLGRTAVPRPVARSSGTAEASGPWSEEAARRLLAASGVPVVPGGLAGSADEAVEIARRVGLPVALKVCSAQITHKSDIGGVALGLGTEAEVRAAYEKVRAAG